MKLRIDNLVECYQSSAIKYCTTVKRLKRFIIKKRQKKEIWRVFITSEAQKGVECKKGHTRVPLIS